MEMIICNNGRKITPGEIFYETANRNGVLKLADFSVSIGV